MSNQKRFALIGRGFGSDSFNQAVADYIGSILADSSEIDFTYTAATPSITAALKSTLPGAYTFTGDNLFTGDFEVLGSTSTARIFVDNSLPGSITLTGGTNSGTNVGGDIRITAGAGGFVSGDGGIVLIRGGATGDSPAGLAALEGGRAFGTGQGGNVGFQAGQSDGGQGGHGTFYSGSGASHVGDLYFGLGQNGAYIALRIVGDTHAWEINGSAGTASQSILQSGGSAGAPSWLTAGTNDRLLRQTGGALNFGQLTAGMFPNTVVPDAALSSNVPLLNASNVFTATTLTLSNTSGVEMLFIDPDSGTNQKRVAWRNSGGQIRIISRDDSNNFVENLFSADVNTSAQWTTAVFTSDQITLTGSTEVEINGSMDFNGSMDLSGNATIGQGTATGSSVSVDAANTNTCDFQMRQGAVNRWIFRKDGTSETGSNSGSNFQIIPRADDGSALPNALSIVRATGLVTAPIAFSTPSFTVSAIAALTGIISPTQLAANTDNWSPTNLATATVIRATTDASRNLTGIAAQSTGRILVLYNVGAFDLVLVHDATSTAANRFLLPNSANLTLNPNDSITLWYDLTSARWRPISGV